MSDQNQTSTSGRWLSWADGWRATIAFVLLVLLVRLVYLAFLCPYALIEDEAHYWLWSQHLGWSYYSKGPGIAYAIALGTSVFGDTELGVRATAPVFSAIATLAVAGLAIDIARDKRAGFVAAVVFTSVFAYQALALIMTIDGPLLACWAVACWAGYRALERESRWAWIVVGLSVGIGFLFKYTALLVLVGLIAHVLLSRSDRERPERHWWWALGGLLLLVVCTLPVFMWNSQNDWVTVRHLLGHLGVAGGDVRPSEGDGSGYDPRWTLEMLGVQFGIAGPAQVLAMVFCVWLAFRRRAEHAELWPAMRYAIVCGLPVLVFYLLVSFVTEVEGNWPIAGYVTLCSLCGWGIVDAMDEWSLRVKRWRRIDKPRPKEGTFRRQPELARQIAWHATVVSGVVVGVFMMRIDLLTVVPVLGEKIPMGRLTAAREVARQSQERAEALEERTGLPTVYICQHYGRASLLAFYTTDDRAVYCSSAELGGRETQFDYWRWSDLSDLEGLSGVAGLLTGATREQWSVAFDRVEPLGVLGADHKRRPTFAGVRFRGFPARTGHEQ